MGIGQYLKELITSKGISLKELSRISGVSVNTLYSITQKDPKTITNKTAQLLSKALDVPVENFLSPKNDHTIAETLTQKMKDADMSVQDLERYSRIPLNRLRNMLNGLTRILPEDEFKIIRSINYYNRMQMLDEDIDLDKKLNSRRDFRPLIKHVNKTSLLDEFENMLQQLDIDSLKVLIFIADSMVKAKYFEDKDPHKTSDEVIDKLYTKLTEPDDSDE